MKVTLAFSAVFIVLSLLFNLYGYRRIRAILIGDNDQYLLSRAGMLLDKTEVNPVIIPLPDKNSYIRVLSRPAGRLVVLFESPGILSRIPTPVAAGVSDTLGMRVAHVRNTSEDTQAELVLAVSNEGLENNLHLLLTLLIVSSLVSVVLAGIVSYLLASLLLQPLQRIIWAAQNINARKLRDLVPVPAARDELRELSETINAMLGRIDESLQQQQRFFASASHELKTPLSILRTELELGLKAFNLDGNIREMLESLLEEIRRLQEVVTEFLVISQLKAGAMDIYPKPFDLSVLVVKVFSQLMPLLRERGAEPLIQFDPDAPGFVVNADEDKVRMVLINLVENAVKHGLEGGVIACGIENGDSGKEIALVMANAIREEKLDTEDLQQAFVRADRLPNGSGLGLWLCGEIIRAHGGTMSLFSGGHHFRVRMVLPLDESE